MLLLSRCQAHIMAADDIMRAEVHEKRWMHNSGTSEQHGNTYV